MIPRFISRKFSSLKRKIINRFNTQAFQKTHDGLCLHIGCGDVNLPGWVNIDARPMTHVHIVTQDISLGEFNDGSVSAIYLCHVLEHFPFRELESALHIFCKKLKPGGVLYLAVPDFSKIVDTYVEKRDISLIIKPLMGGQEYQFNFHYAIFDRKYLSDKLSKVGFDSIEDFSSIDLLGEQIQDFSLHPLSLNLKAIKY